MNKDLESRRFAMELVDFLVKKMDMDIAEVFLPSGSRLYSYDVFKKSIGDNDFSLSGLEITHLFSANWLLRSEVEKKNEIARILRENESIQIQFSNGVQYVLYNAS